MTRRANDRSAACAVCGKTFARSDTLLRHEKSHHATEDRGPLHRVIDGTFRACRVCAQARSRCSGGVPCGRCKTRNLECTYPTKRKKANSSDGESHFVFSAVTQPGKTHSRSHSPSPSQPRPRTQTLQAQPRPQSQPPQHAPPRYQEFVFSTDMNPRYSPKQPPEQRLADSAPDVAMMDPMQLPAHNQGYADTVFSPTIALPTSSLQRPSSTLSSMRSVTSAPNSMLQQEPYANMPMSMTYQDSFHNQGTSYADAPMYDDPFNLNWIPLSIYPSPYAEMDQDFSLLLPTMSDTTSLSNDLDSVSFDTNIPVVGQRDSVTSNPPPEPDLRVSTPVSKLIASPTSSHSPHSAATAVSTIDATGHEHRRKRQKTSQTPSNFSRPRQAREAFFFPHIFSTSQTKTKYGCSNAVYTAIAAKFESLCRAIASWKPFSDSVFPAHTTINACIDLYFEHLHSTFPLLHAPTFAENADWLVCLATATIGSTFASFPGAIDAREAFQEFLRRAILVASDDEDPDSRCIPLAQARVLHLISLANSERKQLRAKAPKSHADLSQWCLESGVLQLTSADKDESGGQDASAAWSKWIEQESLRRIGYLVWYLDCAFGYVCNARPLCNMDDARAPLPCPENLWDASSAQTWISLRRSTPKMPSLCEALEIMYDKKKVDASWSETSCVLLIHALYSRTWEVGTHIKQPLSEWKATGSSRGFLNTPVKDNFWLPLYPLYANWRNSACDCLDMLHWNAQAQMARNAGVEHHGFLHLHLARVILLTPFQEIQDLIFALTGQDSEDSLKASFYVHDGSYQDRDPTKLQQIRKILWRWLREDQHKARLAIIHAGSVFWHVRRYSTNSFMEPVAIYLATMVLWTYGSYKSAALDRNAVEAATNAVTAARRPSDSDSNNFLEQTQSGPGEDTKVQPTRVERAAQQYANSRARSTRSRSSHNAESNKSVALSQTSPNSAHTAFRQGEDQSSETVLERVNTREDGNGRHHDSSSTYDPGSDDDSDSDSSDDDQPSFIHLDRPCDDEIVQHFVRNGHNMSGYMSNVGDICKTPQKVLIEGAKILRTRLASWGVSREYHDILTKLSEARATANNKAIG